MSNKNLGNKKTFTYLTYTWMNFQRGYFISFILKSTFWDIQMTSFFNQVKENRHPITKKRRTLSLMELEIKQKVMRHLTNKTQYLQGLHPKNSYRYLGIEVLFNMVLQNSLQTVQNKDKFYQVQNQCIQHQE
ncbi:unnamed protein product [Paramecium octaurelia]|uniref:Uncharacterized protein n=1 Tax=Paramecium octaurelia TaxID=43137 RepID=A0A8S1YKL2_PAROT|nr:unnamed protein product [Paramecium octaurelia]